MSIRPNINRILFGILIVTICSCKDEKDQKHKNDNVQLTELSWDFSHKKTYSYSYQQNVKNQNTFRRDQSPDKSKIIGNGNLNVWVKDNDHADLSLTNLKMDMITFDEHGEARDTISNDAPPSVIHGMKPNGSFESNSHNVIFDLIFPLPHKNLSIGESDKIPLQMPYNAGGTELFVKGFNTIEYVGNEMLNSKDCAVLKGKIDISNLEIPEELDGIYKGEAIGNATYYFDLKNRCFAEVDLQIDIKILIDTEASAIDTKGIYGNIESENEFKIRLDDITE